MKRGRECRSGPRPDPAPGKLVFIDETGTSTGMARLHGRAPRGERCRAPVPHGHWKTATLAGALRLSGMTAPMTPGGAMNGGAFRACADRVPVPALSPGDVVIMDSLPARKPAGIRDAIERAIAVIRGGAPVPAAPRPRLQSGRDGLPEDQGLAEKRRAENGRAPVGRHRRVNRQHYTPTGSQLLYRRRI